MVRTIGPLTVVLKTNKYFQEASPWSTAEQVDRNVPSELSRVIYNTAESLRIAGILLQPFMPTKATQLLDTLGVAGDAPSRNFEAARFGADHAYGVPLVELKKGTEGSLFPPLLTEV